MAEEKQINQTTPGGVYVVNGLKVDAWGKPLGETKAAEESGSVESEDGIQTGKRKKAE
jgi:hypothetical protein